MVHENLPPAKSTEALREAPDVLTMEWLIEHTNMEIALRAYEEGVRAYGPTSTNVRSKDGREKLKIVQENVPITHASNAAFSLTDQEVQQALCLLPAEWLKHAKLKEIAIIPPQYFCFGDMKKWDESWAGNSFIQGVLDGTDAESHFAGEEVSSLREKNLTGPPTRFHYAPGQYRGRSETPNICLWEEPESVRSAITVEARKEYGRELVVHEALHSVFYEDMPIEFFVKGYWRGYTELVQQFRKICQAEPVAVTEYSELYSPWIRLPFDADADKEKWKKNFRVYTALQEELGECISAYIRGWGATPDGQAERFSDRDFGGEEFAQFGRSCKMDFVSDLIHAPVRVKTVQSSEVAGIQNDTETKVIRASE